VKSPAIIMAVDDNPINLKRAAELLECEGHSVFASRRMGLFAQRRLNGVEKLPGFVWFLEISCRL
jgi:CheY-like chemotaxis protein